MKLSIADVQSIMRQAGWPEDTIVVGSAVAYFESGGGNTDIASYGNAQGTEDSWGLFQINRCSSCYGRQFSVAQLKDPLFNAQVALYLYQHGGWQHWYNTYYGGRYKQYLPAAQAAYQGGSYNPAADVGGNGSSGDWQPSDNQSDLGFNLDQFEGGGWSAPVVIGVGLAIFFVARRFELI